MHLGPVDFKMVKDGIKTIEVRVNDEKRRALKIGDVVQFKNLKDDSSIEATITRLRVFKSFKELNKQVDLVKVGFSESDSVEDVLSCYAKYYSKEEENKFGVVAIYLSLK